MKIAIEKKQGHTHTHCRIRKHFNCIPFLPRELSEFTRSFVSRTANQCPMSFDANSVLIALPCSDKQIRKQFGI